MSCFYDHCMWLVVVLSLFECDAEVRASYEDYILALASSLFLFHRRVVDTESQIVT